MVCVLKIMGQTTPKMCHTQEIAFEPTHDEWRPVDDWSEDLTPAQPCEPPGNCQVCCKPPDSHVDEVLVVHHEALQKVDFLLRHDELTSCEAPVVPECVTAVRRGKILKRLMEHRTKAQNGVREDTDTSVGSLREIYAIAEMQQPCQNESDEDSMDSLRAMLPPSDFDAEKAPSPQGSLDQRLRKGLEMWTLSRGQGSEILQEAVLMQKLEWDASALRITGDRFQATLPLANMTCVELTTSADGANAKEAQEERKPSPMANEPEEKGVYVYLTGTKKDKKAPEGAYHFAFRHAQDAHDFRSWMRTFYPSHVLSASDTDPVPGTC